MSEMKLSTRDMEILSKVFQCFQSAEAMKIDTEKLAQLAGFSNGKSANASWLVLKKKLMNGAVVEATATSSTPKKAKGAAVANADANKDNDATPTKATPKKRGNATKTEPTDAEAGDADNEITPSAESPKKGRAKKATAASKTEVNGDADNNAASTEATTPTPKRKRGPNKPKDPNASPSKRTKKGANAVVTEANNNNVTDAQLQADQPNEGGSLFRGDAKNEVAEEEGDNRPLDDEEEQKLVNDLHDQYLNTHTENEVA